MILIKTSKLWVSGIALYPFVVAKKTAISKKLLHHEKIHLRQQIELLLIPFYVWYLLEYLYHYIRLGNGYLAYRNISFEREAYENESNFDYLKQRKWASFLKYL